MSGYEMLVSLNGLHFFTTSTMTMTHEKAGNLLATLQEKFPESEGYKVVCLRWKSEGREVSLEELS